MTGSDSGVGSGTAGPSGGGGPLGVLQRILDTPVAREGKRCELCNAEVGEEHPHVINSVQRNLLCACRACGMLFTHEGAAQGRYRTVPDRYLRLPSTVLDRVQWEQLQIPVGMAFFFYNSHLERTVAFYPSPAGATESLLESEEWERIVAETPVLADLTPDVEALLVRDLEDEFRCYVVPIDSCYELVGHLRLRWKGFDGGSQAREAIATYFDDVHARARPVPEGGAGEVAGV